ncbi:Gti1/Pac2 family-domain-containing protein [Fomes fomentarius]|nr:Gti1/Pac2 family-domain-containing protein [Fomes fomentarius]
MCRPLVLINTSLPRHIHSPSLLPRPMARQSPTITNLRVRNVRDAEIILHAVALGILPMVVHRLADEERLALRSGCIYVWEERSSNPLEATGQEIQRFTEGRSWGPSRARDNFLIYYEKDSPSRSSILHRNNVRNAPQLIKQTYSVFIDYPKNSRKWHLNAYYTQDSLESLRTVDDIPLLTNIEVPRNCYVCARNNGVRRNARPIIAPEPMMSHIYDVSPTPSSSSTTSSDSDSPPYARRPSPPMVPSHPPIPPVAPLPAGIKLSDRRLAPLEYLQNISPKARDPADDEALRQFQWTMSPM